jgi:hypothetical protein
LGNLTYEPLQLILQGPGQLDVLDSTAIDAHQVVVVTGQPLGDLISSDALGAVMGHNDTGRFEDRERAIQRRHRNPSSHGPVQLGCGQRSAGTFQRCHYLTSTPGVADPRVS